MPKQVLTEEQKLAAFLAAAETDYEAMEDLPEYAEFPSGVYKMLCTNSDFNTDDGYYGITFKLLDVVEVKPEEAAKIKVPEPESLFGQRFYGEIGVKRTKPLFAAVREVKGVRNLPELHQVIENTELIVEIKTGYSKKLERNISNIVDVAVWVD